MKFKIVDDLLSMLVGSNYYNSGNIEGLSKKDASNLIIEKLQPGFSGLTLSFYSGSFYIKQAEGEDLIVDEISVDEVLVEVKADVLLMIEQEALRRRLTAARKDFKDRYVHLRSHGGMGAIISLLGRAGEEVKNFNTDAWIHRDLFSEIENDEDISIVDAFVCKLEAKLPELIAERDAEISQEAERSAEINQLKQAHSIINGWSSFADIDLPFLKKFFIRILKEMKD